MKRVLIQFIILLGLTGVVMQASAQPKITKPKITGNSTMISNPKHNPKPATKVCSVCRQSKSLQSFTGKSKICKTCVQYANKEKARMQEDAMRKAREQESISNEKAERERLAQEQEQQQKRSVTRIDGQTTYPAHVLVRKPFGVLDGFGFESRRKDVVAQLKRLFPNHEIIDWGVGRYHDVRPEDYSLYYRGIPTKELYTSIGFNRNKPFYFRYEFEFDPQQYSYESVAQFAADMENDIKSGGAPFQTFKDSRSTPHPDWLVKRECHLNISKKESLWVDITAYKAKSGQPHKVLLYICYIAL